MDGNVSQRNKRTMWKDLTLEQKAEIMKMSVANGVTDINDIQQLYDGSVGHRFDDAGRIITVGQFPEGFVEEYGETPISTPSSKSRTTLKEAFNDPAWRELHVDTSNVPYLTDYLLRQDQANSIRPSEGPTYKKDFATSFNEWKEEHPTLNTIANYTPFVSTVMDGLELYTDPSWGNLGWFAADLASDIFSLGLAKGVTTGGRLINKALKGSKTITGRSRYIDWDKTSKIPLGDIIEGGDKLEKYGKQTFYQGTDLLQNHIQNTIQDDDTELSLGGHLFDNGGSKSKKGSTRGTNYHTNEAQAFVDELVAAGVSPVDAWAVAGNVWVESRFNHEASNNINGGHWGLVQNDANIKRHIIKYYGDYSRNSQMQFLKDGLTGQIKGAKNARWLQQRFDDYRRHSAGVKDASVAAKYFHDDYERSRNEMVADRMKAASFYQTGIATNPTIAAFNRVYGNQNVSVPDIDYESLYEPAKIYGLDWSNRPQQEEEQIIQRPTEPIMSVMEREEPQQEQPAAEQDNFVQLPSFRLSSLQNQPIAAQQRHALVTPVMQAAAQEAPSEVQSILSSPYIIFGRDLG